MLYDISTAAAHLESARAYLAGHLGLTAPQYNMLMVIAQYGGDRGLSVSEVGAHLHVSSTFITAEMNKLAKLGVIAKVPNPDDARSVLLQLTQEGGRQVQGLQQELHFVNDRLFASLTATEFDHLSRIIAKLLPDFERTVAVLTALSSTDSRRSSAQGSRTNEARRGRAAVG